jgi:murein L,D-transpeptidase YcbB/YkuD
LDLSTESVFALEGWRLVDATEMTKGDWPVLASTDGVREVRQGQWVENRREVLSLVLQVWDDVNINATGVVAQQTFQALNVPAQDRLRQLELNLVRLRSFAANLGPRFITMNIPAAAVETVENGMVFSHHAAGVGKIDRQSPVMQAKVVEINFNPFWTVPASIIRKDLIPKMQADPNYLTDNKIRVIDKAGNEVPPTAVNWNSMDAVNYRFRQDPGADVNSLGVVRVNIHNPHGVYMHDTPAKGVFGDDYRFVSSGCVRVQNIRDYVAWIHKDKAHKCLVQCVVTLLVSRLACQKIDLATDSQRTPLTSLAHAHARH